MLAFFPYVLLFLFLGLFAMMLLCHQTACYLAALGLTIWFERMIPVLLPFMILSGILTGFQLQKKLLKPFSGITTRLFAISDQGAYCILMGFLCGFPMGAFCISDLHQKHLISAQEGRALMPYCNHIGPVYFYSFALPIILQRQTNILQLLLFTFGMYGIPLLMLFFSRHRERHLSYKKSDSPPGIGISPPKTDTSLILDQTIHNSVQSMLRLGGYMILFNLLMLPGYLFLRDKNVLSYVHCLFEISGGLSLFSAAPATSLLSEILLLTLLSFGGFSCFAQTLSYLREINLKPSLYLQKKLLIALCSFFYYAIIYSIL